MKKLFLLFALMGLVAVGCSHDEMGKIFGDYPENIFFGLDKESITFSPDGGSVDIIVYSNYKWEISGISDWCAPSVKAGDANEDGQKVTFTADVAYDDREAIFWFRCADEKIKFAVSQKFKEAIIPDANNTLDIPAEGGTAVISYQTTVDCDVIIPEEVQDWITVVPAVRGLVSENINLAVAENTTYSARTAVVKVVAKDNASLVVEYTINQAQNDAILADENNTFTVPCEGGNIVLDYQTNVDCEVIIPEEAQEWITIAPATRGLVTCNTTLNIAANFSNKQRSSVVKVVSQEDNELFAEYTITQDMGYFLLYTSSDGKIVTPYSSSPFDATILSNTYKGGVGVIHFNTPITTIGEWAFRDCSSLTSVIIGDGVTTIGAYAFMDCSNLTSVTIPDSVTEIGLYAFENCSSLQKFNGKIASEDGRCLILEGTLKSFAPAGLTEYSIPDSVTEIEEWAFYGCSSLTSITIPDSVTTIGWVAFRNCSSLTSVIIGDSVTTIGRYAFENCSSLTSITIPDSVTEIGLYAFENCSSLQKFNGKIASEDGRCLIMEGVLYFVAPAGLTEYSIPNSVTEIGADAFMDCSSLTSVTIPDSVTTIGESAFYGCRSLTSVIIGDGVTEIGEWAFRDCSSLTIVTIPDSVTTIGERAFYGCRSLTSVIIGDGVTEIGEWAFRDCSSLTCVIIGDGVTTIGADAFGSCYSLTNVTIPDSVTEIGADAFMNCSSLTSVTIPDSVTTIGEGAFSSCSSLTSVIIGDGVTEIGNKAFRNCSSLTSVTIPDSVTEIGLYAFMDCSSLQKFNGKIASEDGRCLILEGTLKSFAPAGLTEYNIPDSVTEIEESAFRNCSSLTSITIPDSVTTIGNKAFYGCDFLTNVYSKPTTPPSVYSGMFSSNVYGRKIYVPMESVSKYKSANVWKDYASSIVGYNF